QSKNPRVISTIPAITQLSVESTTVEYDSQERVLFYTAEQEVLQPDGTKAVVRQTAGQARSAYLEYEAKRQEERDRQENVAKEAKTRELEAQRTRREEALSPSSATVTYTVYRKGTPEEVRQDRVNELMQETKGKTYQLPDFSDSYKNEANDTFDFSVLYRILRSGMTQGEIAQTLDGARRRIMYKALIVEKHAEAIADKTIADLQAKLDERKGQKLSVVASVQRHLGPHVMRALLRKTRDNTQLSFNPEFYNYLGFRPYPVEAIHRWIARDETPSPKTDDVRVKELLDDDFMYHALFFDIVTQSFFPNRELSGEEGELLSYGIHLIAQQFDEDEIIELLSAQPFDEKKAQTRYQEAQAQLRKLRSAGKKVRREVVKEAEEEESRARRLLQDKTSVLPMDIAKRIEEAIRERLPESQPLGADYEEREQQEPRAFTRAVKNYEKAVKRGIKAIPPKREEYGQGEESLAFTRDENLYETWMWLKTVAPSLQNPKTILLPPNTNF
ncbi:MAG TPA: hypothetical protein VFQ63_03860, partial [Patescibacteria group bacterium]|nr:hypothetical protein [Patescibacteria group bacterium]